MKKTIAALTLICFLAVVPVKAHAEPVTAAIITAGAVGSLLVAGAAANYYKPTTPPAISHAVTVAGAVARSAMMAYHSMNTYFQDQMWGKLVTAKMALTDVYAKAAAAPTTYPLLKAATSTQTNAPYALPVTSYAGTSYPHTVGTPITYNGANYVVASYAHLTSGGCTNVCMTSDKPPTVYMNYPQAGHMEIIQNYDYGPKDIWIFDVSSPPTPIYAAATVAQFKASIAPSGTVTDTATQAEIDTMIASNQSSVSVVDDANPGSGNVDNSPPVVPPSSATTTSQAPPSITGLGTQGAVAATTALTAAQTNVATKQAAVDTAQDIYNANPTPSTLADLRAKQAELSQAQTGAQAAANTSAQAQQANEEAYPDIAKDAVKHFDFSKLNMLKNIMANTFPFSLLTGLVGYYNVFLGEPTPPVFTIPMPLGNEMTVDLTSFNPIAEIMRWVIGTLMSIGIIYVLVRFWRGVA